MTKKEKITFIRRQLSELETHEMVLKQALSSITSRKSYLEQELDSVGASNSTRKGKSVDSLSDEVKTKLLARLTQ